MVIYIKFSSVTRSFRKFKDLVIFFVKMEIRAHFSGIKAV